ncbi:hypothetical protein T05_13526 [Trichinella murrelli]|uniref:Uncharacterized protein n=1 Tax=Trichinella murrelli TaxID=144512 RepID=A0A0V0T6Z8_9BILA|nr:hypothetical protein T05_13526 [Trichinella murrelli]
MFVSNNHNAIVAVKHRNDQITQCSTNVIIISNFCPGDVLSSAQVSYPSLTSRLKSHHCTTFLQYLGKYAFVRLATRRFWEVPYQTNP